MKTIVIQIQVPDGVDVRVSQGGATAPARGGDRAFVEREPPPPPTDGGCPVHGVDWRLVPAGVSRTKVNADGTPKRFNAFWACPERGCDEKPSWDDDAPAGDPYSEQLPF